MQTIKLKPITASPGIFSRLQRRGLIRTLKPTSRILRLKGKSGAMETVYASHPAYGSHKLACIRCNSQEIKLNWHPDNEEFILINSNGLKFNPLYMIIGLHKNSIMEKKARNGSLSCGDFLALELKYNDPGLSIFTMLKGTLHCEFVKPGRHLAPIFYVCEPSRLRMEKLKAKGYRFSLLI